MSNGTRRHALADASMAATRLHLQLGTPMDRSVDVFALAQQIGLWVSAQPLDPTLCGFYLREEAAAGLVINSRHPETLQRFTCGHEIGHHALGHDSLTDFEDSLNSYSSQLQTTELAAQVFAASLLMPLPLVNRVLASFGERQRHLRPSDVYLFSREIGVSFTAAVWQLQQLRRLDRDTARLYAKRGVAAAKLELRGGPHIADARADVWILDEAHNELSITCRPGDEIHTRLPEDLSTGYAWTPATPGGAVPPTPDTMAIWGDEGLLEPAVQLAGEDGNADDDEPLALVVDEHVSVDGVVERHLGGAELGMRDIAYEAVAPVAEPGQQLNSDDLAGWPPLQAGTRTFVFVARSPGRHDITLLLNRPWEDEAQAVYRVTVHVAAARSFERPGLAQPQRDARVRQLAAA